MRPRVTIGIPLYRAAARFDDIVRNIDSIGFADVEILISDRHLFDDALGRLEERYGGDPRVRCIRHDDCRGWVDNYNLLLEEAAGEYFTWLPQDNDLAVPLEDLVATLDRDPSVILAYPRLELADASGRALATGRRDLTVSARSGESWGFHDAWSVAARLRHYAAAKGLFRLDVVRNDRLSVQPVWGGLLATDAFRFGLACRGRFEMVPSAVARNRLHRGNFTARSPVVPGRYLHYFSVARGFHPEGLGRTRRLGRDAALFVATVLVAPSVRGLWRWTPRGRRARAGSRA